jgi:copper resistance protein C
VRRGRDGLRRVVVVVLLGIAGMLGAAGPAFAHSTLLGSNPADGASVDTGPSQISLTFNEDMPPGFDVVTVVGPDGKVWQNGEVTTSGPTVSVPVAPLGPAGRYQVGYRVVSADGHPVQGKTSFTLTRAGSGTAPAQPAPATGPAAAAAPSDGGGGTPVWPWILGAVVLVGAGVAAALRLGRG